MVDLTPLIATKFNIPTLQRDLVLRPRLRAMLVEGAHQALTLISAPPGFGKTMLVAQWAKTQVDYQVAWLSLDESDSQRVTFWRYVIGALQHRHPGMAETAQIMLSVPALPPIETILATLINEVASLNQPILLVLDDYHLVQNPEVHKSLTFFLDHLPEYLHLFILTREDPPLNLARRRARRQMVEIRAAELRFEQDETSAFLQSMGLALTQEQITILDRRTEGWIAGLQMAALSLRGHDPETFFQSFTGDDRYIADYLIEEVLSRQPEQIRDFLLRTSILERMNASICDAILRVKGKGLGEGPSPLSPAPSPLSPSGILEYLDKSNLFLIPLDNRREWYRYHHLFADLLRQRLKEDLPAEQIALLYQAASLWCEEHGEVFESLRYARQVPDEPRVAGLLKKFAGWFFTNSKLPEFVEFANTLSPVLVEAFPDLCMAAAWGSLATYQSPERWLSVIEQHFGLSASAAVEDAPMPASVRAALLEVLIVRQQLPFQMFNSQTRLLLHAIQRQFDALSPDQYCLFNTILSLKPVLSFDLGLHAELTGEAESAASYFSEAIRLASQDENFHLLNLAYGHLANIQICLGKLRAAQQTFQQALARQAAAGKVPYTALAHAGLGTLNYEWGNLAVAESHFKEGLELARIWNQWESLLPIQTGLARLQRRQGNFAKALDFLDELRAPPDEGMLIMVKALRALWLAQNGDLDSAAAWLDSSGVTAYAAPLPVNEPLLLDVARLMCCLGRGEEAVKLAGQVAQTAEACGRLHSVLQGKLVLAKAYAQLGKTPEALVELTDAVHLAEPEGYLSRFIDEGDPIRPLLTRLEGLPYARQVLAGFPAQLGAAQKPLPSPAQAALLSEREHEVILLVAEGLSNQEIAERLFISLPTVKSHINHIFNKLAVSNRMQAIARLEDLGLIPHQ